MNRTSFFPSRTRGPSILAGVICAAFAAGVVAADAPLRYRFEPGQWLIYERQVRIESIGVELPPRRYAEQVQIWCLERRLDDALLLVDVMRVVGDDVEPASGILLHLDERGGRRLETEALRRTPEVLPALDLLPHLDPALPDGQRHWITPADPLHRAWRLAHSAAAPETDGSVVVDVQELDPVGVTAALRRGLAEGRLWFDPVRGRVTRAELTQTDAAGATRTLSRVRLFEERTRPPEWLALRRAEADHFARSLRSEDRLLDELTLEPERMEQTLRGLDRLWLDSQASIADATSPFRRLAAARRQLLRDRAALLQDRARMAREEVGRPASSWALPAHDGETLRSEQLRDRLCVEMEWRGDDADSVRMLPVLRALRSAFPLKDLSIVAINTGPDLPEACRALAATETGLIFLSAQRRGEPPRELPVVRVIGPDQRVRRCFLGWRPTLGDDLRPLVEGVGK